MQAAKTLKSGVRYKDERPNSYRRGYNKQWRKVRRIQLARQPLCVRCMAGGRITTATDVDHIRPHKGDYKLMYDMSNLQSLCHSCHSIKTATEDGGFGKKKVRKNTLKGKI